MPKPPRKPPLKAVSPVSKVYGITAGPRFFFADPATMAGVQAAVEQGSKMVKAPLRSNPQAEPRQTVLVVAHISSWEELKETK